MAREQIPVTPAVVKWARKRSGYSVDELLLDFKRLEEWETGESYPTYAQLERLAEKLKLPIAVFFFPDPPDVAPLSESFRTLPEAEFAQIPPRVLHLLGKARAMQLNLSDLNNDQNPSDRLVTRDLAFDHRFSLAAEVGRVRQYLGVSIEQQSAWKSAEEALENWRQILTDVGIFVFKDAFRVDGYSGFCLYDDEFPIIYLNNSTAKTRQIFTLFHELAHLLFRTSGVDKLDYHYIDALPQQERRIEIVCNRFAARFLVPEHSFEAEFAGREATEETAQELADQFHVSREVIFRIFLDRNLIDEDHYKRAAAKWAAPRARGSGGDYYNTQISYLGPRYINLAFREYYRNRINDVQLAGYLNISPKNLTKFEERFARRGS